MLLPVIDQQFAGVIWRIEIDILSDTIFLEIRSADKQVSFSSLNLVTGAVNFTGYTTPERWLTGMEAAYNGILLLHNYQSENTPTHKGITAVNSNGEVSWSNYTYAFDHLSVNGPILFNTQLQPKKLFLVDVKTGERLRQFEQTIDTEVENYIVAPQILSPDQLQLTLPAEPYGNIIHYVDHNNFRIVSLHTLNAAQLQQQLYIMDGPSLVYEDLLSADIQKMQPESFIMYKNSLIYIKNKSELRVLNL
ncbi:MAG: DUF4905 domain-containing protein [Mucilaginibacter sp.]|nr:DUF4905 domain-containing protein [Mucilaginibacter sp.]